MNDHDSCAQEAIRQDDNGAERAVADPVEVVVASYLDYLEGITERPALDQLTAVDRRRAVEAINSMLTGRGIQLGGSTPSVEALLAGTELESLLPRPASAPGDRGEAGGQGGGLDREAAAGHAGRRLDRKRARVEQIAAALHRADSRVTVRAEPHKLLGPAVTATYLDLQVVFVPIDGPAPAITQDARSVLSRVLNDDTDLDSVGVVADSTDLLTQLVSASDLGRATATPSDGLQLRCPAVLPLPLALAAMLELAAPVWEPFTVGTGPREPLQLGDIAAEAARRVLARESSRRYHGDKGRAYKSLAGTEAAFTRLIIRLATPGTTDAAMADAIDQIALDAA
jgi:hypothetical protein